MLLNIPLQKRITDLEKLKVLSNSLRLQILEYIYLVNREGKLVTVKQLADHLNQPITKLYYHTNMLEEHELIVVEETRIVSGILEKHYRVSAQRLTLDQDIFAPANDRNAKKEIILSLVETVLERTYQSLQDFAHAQMVMEKPQEPTVREMHVSRELVRINMSQAEEFHKRLSALVGEYEALTPDDLSAPVYTFGLTTLFYPVLDETPPPEVSEKDP